MTVSNLELMNIPAAIAAIGQSYQRTSMRTMLSALRNFLSFLWLTRETSINLTAAVPSSGVRKVAVVPTLTPEEETKLLSVIDRSIPAGKRNYAMVLLAMRTGLRTVDIINLKLKDIDWRNNTINLVQQKNRRPLSLPLLPEVGNAMVDYILQARPKSDEPYLFLKLSPPFSKLTDCYGISHRIMDKAEISQQDDRFKEFHLFRHSVASKMLNSGVSLSVISNVLGHKSAESSKMYLSTDGAHLKACALTLQGIEVAAIGVAMSYSYSGNLSRYNEGLIENKQMLGYPYNGSARILKHFDSYCIEHWPYESIITKEMGLGWATLKENEHQNGLMRRISPVRRLAKYMHSIGVEAYIIPPKIPNKQIRYVPHIYTAAEITAFFNSIDSCRPSPFNKTRHLVIPVFFRLLYCCGLRSSEARLLHVSDVDLLKGTVYIRKSKGYKNRLVYLSDDLIQLCEVYDKKVKQLISGREAFFPNQEGQFYNKSTVDCWFHEFWDHLPAAKHCSGNLPRVHDFRHSFAVKRLNLWVEEGKNINAYLPYLSIYLGHVKQADTDYYLHLVPEFFPLFREKASRISADILPEVHHE